MKGQVLKDKVKKKIFILNTISCLVKEVSEKMKEINKISDYQNLTEEDVINKYLTGLDEFILQVNSNKIGISKELIRFPDNKSLTDWDIYQDVEVFFNV